MSKELPYFRFTVQDWQNGKVSIESYELQGLFISVCGYYWINDCSITLTMLKKKFSNATALLDELIELDILKYESRHDKVEIVFLNEQFDLLSEKRKLRQVAGSKGGKAKAMLKQKSSYKDKDKDNDKDKDKFWQKWTFAWHEHVLLKTNSKPVFSGKAVKNLKTIREYFLKQDNRTTGQKNAENEALFCFEYILKHWELLDSFKQKKFNLAYMAENIPEYLSDIKNAKSGKTGQKTENKIDTAKNNLEKGLETLRKEAMQNAS